ncbi:MAG: tyrosine--tRNA ligase [Microgenomates group bacterium]|jgi:tyrosyl-tRNA synthetase
MTTDEKIKLITRNLEECLTEEELKELIESGISLKHYIGFEISGKVHLGQGIAVMNKVREMHDAGAETVIWLADWHGWINNKLDGTLETASRMAKEYFTEAMKAAYLCVGGNPDDLVFKQGSEIYNSHPEFWATTIKVAKATTISRMMRSTDIMGRTAGESSNTATLFYPAMQAADIFQLEVNIAHAGTDQRNVHIVARDAAKEIGFKKPIAIHHHLIMGLKPLGDSDDIQAKKNMSYEEKKEIITALKMSKSKPDTAVFITDSPEEIKKKINNAYCPEGDIEFNPILDWTKHLIFYNEGVTLEIERPEKFGGNVTYSSYEDLEKNFTEKKLHPMDLKAAVASWLIRKLEPARKHFEDPKRKAALEEIEKLIVRK